MPLNHEFGDFARSCFDQIKGFGSYGFPESHAVAYLVYISSWIKCHHPAVFACALLNAQPMGFYAPAQIVRDAQEHGVEIRGRVQKSPEGIGIHDLARGERLGIAGDNHPPDDIEHRLPNGKATDVRGGVGKWLQKCSRSLTFSSLASILRLAPQLV